MKIPFLSLLRISFCLRLRRLVGLCLLAQVFAGFLIPSMNGGISITLTPNLALVGPAPARPSFGIRFWGGLHYDANGNSAQDAVNTYTVGISGYGNITSGYMWDGNYFYNFSDPRGNLGTGIYFYSVGGTYYQAADYNMGWQEGHWEDEHDNPDDPDEVTGSHWVDGSYDAGFNWTLSSFGDSSLQFNLQAGTAQTITFANPGARNLSDVFTLCATASSGLPVSYSLLAGGGSFNGSAFTATTAGVTTVRASRAAGANGSTYFLAANAVDQTFTVVALSQTLSGFSTIPAHTFLDAPFTVSATASSGLPVTFAITSGPATLSGNTVTMTGAGNVTVTAAQAGNGTYAPVTASQTFTVAKANQTLAFPSLPTRTQGEPAFNPGATASSGLLIIYTVVAGPATVSGNLVTVTAPGTITVQACQPGNANFNPASGSPTQTFSALSAIAVTQTSSGATPPTFSIAFTPGVSSTGNWLHVVDSTTGVTVGDFWLSSNNTWGSVYAGITCPGSMTATWTDPRGISFNGSHSYKFTINGNFSGYGRTYGPVTTAATITGGPPGSIVVTPGTGGAANFSIALNNFGYGSGVTSLAVRDRTTGESWGPYSTGTVVNTYSTTWTDPRAPTPNGQHVFEFIASGTVGGVPYSFRTEAAYYESTIYLQPVSPTSYAASIQPKFNIAIGPVPQGLSYVKVETAGYTWYITNTSGPSATPIFNNGATTLNRQFDDPRGLLPWASYVYSVTAYWDWAGWVVTSSTWIEGHEDEEHDNPDDPDEVTGSHWVDGYYQDNWEWIELSEVVDQETIGLPDLTAPTVPGPLVASAITGTSFSLTWGPSTDAAGVTAYEVRHSGVPAATTATTSASFSELLSGATYTAAVRARDAAGNWSAWATLSVQTVASSTNVGFSGSATSAYTAALAWNATADPSLFAGYKVFRKLGAGAVVAVGSTSDLGFSDSGLASGTTYTYSLRRFNHLGDVESSDLASVIVTTTATIAGHSDADGIPDTVEQLLLTPASTTLMAIREDAAANFLQSNVHRPN